MVQQFGYDRAFHVLAITSLKQTGTGGIFPTTGHRANAMSIPANPDAWGTDRNCYLAVNSHPGLVGSVSRQTRKAYAQEHRKPLSGTS